MSDAATAKPGASMPDGVTVAAIAIVTYALANILHEAVGHGGACILLGGRPLVLSSVHFEYDEATLGIGARRIVSAAGTATNFAAALVTWALMRSKSAPRGSMRFALWLFLTINLLMGAGYFLFSGIGKIGDWAAVFDGVMPQLVWRPLLAVAGGILYWTFARASAQWLRPFVGEDALSETRARRLTLISYFAGGLLYCVSGLFNPVGPILIAISAAAASFGGTSGLTWLTNFLRQPRAVEPLVEVRRSIGWIVAAALAAVVFIGVLGPSLRF